MQPNLSKYASACVSDYAMMIETNNTSIMSHTNDDIRAAYLEAMQKETQKLQDDGVNLAGQAFSPLLILKGNLSDAEKNGAELLSGADGEALHAALDALGYPPEAWCTAATIQSSGAPLSGDLLRLTIISLQPNTLILCDEEAARVVREAYAEELQLLEDPAASTLEAGILVQVMGMRMLNLGGFADALLDQEQKRIMWARLKQVPPLGAPY